MHCRHIALLAFALIASPLAAADWNRFRGPEGLGVAADKDIPVSFEPKDALWKTPIPGHGNSSPIISKGKIFLQSASNDGSKRSLICINAITGEIEWSKDVKGTTAKIHNKNTLASSSATADGDRVYIVLWDGKHIHLTAWDYAGNQLWSRDLGGFVSQHGPGLSPIVVGDKVILNVDQDELAEVHAFDRKTGDTVWKKSRQAYRASYTTPFVMEQRGKSEVIVSSTAGVTAYDPKDGAIIWNWTWVWKGKGKPGQGGALRHVGGPILHNGLIYAISGDGGGDRHMVAIEPGPDGDVTDSALVWERKRETAYVPMVLGHGDYVYWISDKENKAICVEGRSGKEMWNVKLGGSAPVSASPILVDGKIYSIAEDGRVYVFAAAPKFKSLAENDLKEDVFASPAVADGRLYIRGANHLFCFGKK